MRWDYSVDFRDRFDRGPHRDILIVPHATRVTPVPGGPPDIQSKIPVFIEDPNNPGEYIAKTDGSGNIEYEAVEFVIGNENIIKEQFEYTQNLNSSDNLAFGSTEAAMVKFTIRNTKTYDEEKSKWVLDIPDLAKYQIESDDGKMLIGEVQASAVIEVYTYIDGDSSSLMWCGMYKVEQDKISDNGEEREITAYDFILTFRDMDIFEWYKAKFEGTPIDSDDPSKGKKAKGSKGSKYWYEDEWTLEDLLKDLFSNLTEFSPDRPTVTNPKDYFCEMDPADYPGFGMPIMIDPDILDPNAQLVIPEDPAPNAYEHYGYMPILNLKVRKDEKIIKKGSLSCGKFFEDIAMLAGRFCCIRSDIRQLNEYNEHKAAYGNYMLYDKCILTFRPLLKQNSEIESENILDDSEIEKGLRYDYYDAKDVKLIDIYNYDAKRIIFYCPKGLKESSKKAYKSGKRIETTALKITENMFTSYLDPSKSEHKAIITMLETGTSGVYGGKPLLNPCFNNIIKRSYRPFTLTTTSDLCRQVGDRIRVVGKDKITGEPYDFESYILTRSCKGIQKQTDTYTAKGDIANNNFSDYRSGETSGTFQPQSFGYGRYSGEGNSSSTENTGQSDITVQGLTTNDLIEFLRNDGKRFLDEPSDCEATWDPINSQVTLKWTDPADISDYEPHPCAWEGTVVVRKEGSPPIHRWDGTKVVKSTTRNQYNQNGYIDNNVQKNKVYYYAFMPYFTTLDDEDHPIRRYRPTKVISVNTQLIATAPEIKSLTVEQETQAVVEYSIPTPQSGNYNYTKLVYKKGSEPVDENDGTIVDLDTSETSITISALDNESTYYFEIFTEDSGNNQASSDAEKILTGLHTGWSFGYTGQVQEWTAPVPGVYSLETWGAQGGDAEDDINNLYARGGYGAYAYGEMFLNAGDKLYINVGGQNGYGGGGKVISEISFENFARTLNFSSANCKSTSGSLDDPGLEQYYNTDYPLVWYGDNAGLLSYLPTYSNGEITSQQMTGYFGYIAMPINSQGKKITGIRFKYKTTKQVSGSTYCFIALRSNGIDGGSYFNLIVERDAYQLPTSYTDFTMTLPDGGGVCNYFAFSMHEKFAICFKDIVFICED